MSNAQEIAQTILSQLGGNKFTAMTGANSFVAHDAGLSFRLPGGGFTKDGINYVMITLNSLDLYDVKYMKIRKGKGIPQVKIISESAILYADMLQEDFARTTGLNTRLF